MPNTKTLLMLAVVIFADVVKSQECPSQPTGKEHTVTTALDGVESREDYYLRSGHYAILVPKSLIVSYVSSQVEKRARPSDRQLLGEIRRVPEIGWPIDAFSFAFKNPLFIETISHAFAHFMQRGKAAVIDVYSLPDEPSRLLKSIMVTTRTDGAFSGRTFCADSGDFLLSVVDSIE